MKLDLFFNRHPVFTGDELAAFLASEVSKLMKAAVFLGVHPAALLTELNLTDEQLKQLSKFAMLIQHPEKAKNLDAILTLLKTEEV